MICDLEPTKSAGEADLTDIVNHKTEVIDGLLQEQQTLRTPVALFSDDYDSRSVVARFSHLIPLSKPKPGEQYAFEVNLDACTGCKACVAACHSLNGLDEDESWRDIGMLVGTRKQPYLQTVTTACHHCADPACMNGCPVLAYEKDDITGIVRHLDDQCIGCSYCIMKCPYEVPKFNLKRGIVRKCDMCQGRLAEGEAPACVQACPNEAIWIRTVKVASVPDRGSIVTGAFDSSYTRPTTRYTSTKPSPANARPADASRLDLDHAHGPLAWMLVLTQMSAGAFVTCAAALWAGALDVKQAGITSAVALVVGVVGINLSLLHLGQPLKAWRSFMGWRRSWLSREIIAFGGFAGAGFGAVAAWWWGDGLLMRLAVSGAALAGIVAVLCSVMVYADTRRPFWSLKLTSTKFIGTMLLLGCGLAGAVWAWLGVPHAGLLIAITIALRWITSVAEMNQNESALNDESSAWHRSARILKERLRPWADSRAMLLVMCGIVLPTLIAGGFDGRMLFTLLVILAFASQVIERSYFFTAAAGPKMPGS